MVRPRGSQRVILFTSTCGTIGSAPPSSIHSKIVPRDRLFADHRAIRWRELEIAPDGTKKRVLRYETLGRMSRREASEILKRKMAAASRSNAPTRSRVTFATLAIEWQATVLPMYKHSTQTHRRFMLKKHLLPRFGDKALSEITRQEIQMYVAHLTHDGYAPKSIDHIHDVLSAVLRTAVKWGHLQDNPARGVDLPTLKTVRPKWALTPQQAAALLDKLPPLGRAMVGLAILSGLRRGELFALRWKDIDECACAHRPRGRLRRHVQYTEDGG
jgi:integrase